MTAGGFEKSASADPARSAGSANHERRTLWVAALDAFMREQPTAVMREPTL
jgi:hypothetical protein